MAQVTEDILLSRIDQSGFRPKCVNMIDKPLLPIEVGVISQEIVFIAVVSLCEKDAHRKLVLDGSGIS